MPTTLRVMLNTLVFPTIHSSRCAPIGASPIIILMLCTIVELVLRYNCLQMNPSMNSNMIIHLSVMARKLSHLSWNTEIGRWARARMWRPLLEVKTYWWPITLHVLPSSIHVFFIQICDVGDVTIAHKKRSKQNNSSILLYCWLIY